MTRNVPVSLDLQAALSQIDETLLINLTRELIRIDSVYRPGQGGTEERVARRVAALLREWGLEVKVEEAAPGRPNVMAILRGREPGKTLLFEGHTDVVTEGDPAAWTYPPFAAEVVGNRIYGRGACDTKNNLAAAMVAVKAIQDAGGLPRGEIRLAIPVDEEGLMIGIKQMIRSGWCDGVDGAVICEPEENQLCISQKGAVRIAVTVSGKMAHGAMPRSGINPLPAVAAVIQGALDLETAEISRHGQDPYLGWPSVTPTVVQTHLGGEPQINVVPATAQVTLDIRTIPGQDHEELIRRVEELAHRAAAGVPELTAEIEVLDVRPCTQTAPDDPIVQAAAAAVRQVTGREPVYNGVPGATDGTFLWAWKQIPIVTYGAGGRTVPHQVDEFVEIPELIETARLYVATALNFLSS